VKPEKQYFNELEEKLNKKYGHWSSFCVNVGGHTIKLSFPYADMCENAKRSLYEFIVPLQTEPDSHFYYWNDYFEPIFNSEDTSWQQKVKANPRQMVINRDERKFYYVQKKPPGADYAVHGRTLVYTFSRWASENDMFMLHAACVGAKGKGVLIAGRSGSGKTTFALSCLYGGLDYVSDDYTLINGAGPIKAMPIYSMVGVTPEVSDRFPMLYDTTVLVPKDLSNGKRQFIIPKERFTMELDIKAVIMPVICNASEPELVSVAPGRTMVHLLHSSAVQTGRDRDAELIRLMGQRLSGLPVYEMRMSSQLEKNPKALREFIGKCL